MSLSSALMLEDCVLKLGRSKACLFFFFPSPNPILGSCCFMLVDFPSSICWSFGIKNFCLAKKCLGWSGSIKYFGPLDR